METKHPVLWRSLLGSCLLAVLTALLLASISGAGATKEAPQAADKKAPQATKEVPQVAEEEVRVVAARVNGAPIYEDQVAKQVKSDFRKYQKFRMGPPTPELAKVLRERALEKLIAAEVVAQAGEKLDIPDLDKRVELQLKNYKSKHGAQASQWTDTELRASIRRNISTGEYLKHVGVIDPEIPEADIKEYYDEHGKSFTREEYIHARHILVQVAQDAEPAAKAAARQKIDQARHELVAGKSFPQAAKEYSEDNIAKAGGDLGYIKKGYMPPKFDQVAFALAPHTLSDVVETKYGYHLVEVLDKQPAGVIPYEEMKGFIGKYLKMQVSQKKRQTVIQSLRAKAEVEIVKQ